MTANRFVLVLLFGFVLLYLPARLFSIVVRPARIGISQIGGIGICATGGAIALWSVMNFARSLAAAHLHRLPHPAAW